MENVVRLLLRANVLTYTSIQYTCHHLRNRYVKNACCIRASFPSVVHSIVSFTITVYYDVLLRNDCAKCACGSATLSQSDSYRHTPGLLLIYSR